MHNHNYTHVHSKTKEKQWMESVLTRHADSNKASLKLYIQHTAC